MKVKLHGIQDKVVAITGASSRIGEAAAVMLAERGEKVVIRLHCLARSFPNLQIDESVPHIRGQPFIFQRAKVVLGARGLDRLEGSPVGARELLARSPMHAQTCDGART